VSTNLERVALPALEVGTLDGSAGGQIDHTVGGIVFGFGKEQLGSLEDEVAPAPVLEPHALLGEPSLVVGVVAVEADVGRRIDVRRAVQARHGCKYQQQRKMAAQEGS